MVARVWFDQLEISLASTKYRPIFDVILIESDWGQVDGNAKNTAAARQARRAAFGDITNATKEQTTKDGKKKTITGPLKPKTKSIIPAEQSVQFTTKKEKAEAKVKDEVGRDKTHHDPALFNVSETVTSSQESNASVSLKREEEDFSFIEGSDEATGAAEKSLLSFDEENKDDVFHVSIYAQEIFDYYKRRELMFRIPPYLGTTQCHITAYMRTVLVDWLVEIQENFELNHETLYLAVKLIDLYLSRVDVDVEKEILQLIGCAAVFIASKFDERCPPLIEDFTYICDNAFDRAQFIEMEMEVLRKVDFDLGIPISYRFLRRYAKIGRLSMETLTLARYILELSLMEYDLVKERDSMIAASALYIAMKMRSEGAWEGDIVKTCGYEAKDLETLIIRLNSMLLDQPNQRQQNIFSKYSHIVFHQVAKIKPLLTKALF
ncbi:G2/mitotic-specific cyclin-b3 [Plakobranchus ocellatus]|uniref:G2/mitotic-specific cyclin-b3 n=1 Tax=Plakobranchus ocellatus TaxID=259542 RepID=A0AAV4CGQ4_9GAST|nr:G2/mitotic-specific cyclin-b3 [Plakobranchus ocellatus]